METDRDKRKALPLATGVLDYFPDALMAVAHCSKVGNDQHNAGEPLHWARDKSMDESDALARHFLERGTLDTDGVRHSAKVAWRALALLQKEIEADEELIRKNPYFLQNEFYGSLTVPANTTEPVTVDTPLWKPTRWLDK